MSENINFFVFSKKTVEELSEPFHLRHQRTCFVPKLHWYVEKKGCEENGMSRMKICKTGQVEIMQLAFMSWVLI